MNIFIADLDKIDLCTADIFADKIAKATDTKREDWLFIPKGMEMLQDVPVEWLKVIRDVVDRKLKEIESI
jgi:hypothetical protein